MDVAPIDPDHTEEVGVKYSDNFARTKEWEQHDLGDPVDDLNAFFEALPGDRILDVGCGWARYVYRFLDQGLNYIGVDHSAEMIKAAQGEYPNEQFEHMSYRKLAFPEGSFDGLWCCCAFSSEPKHNMPKVLEGLRRVLVDGGMMMVIMPALQVSYEEMDYGDGDEPFLYHVYYYVDEFEKLLAAAGFTIVETTHRYSDGAMSILVKK